MKETPEHNERMAKIKFASVYPYYIKKVESKGRTKEELHEVIRWLTGFDDRKLQELIDENVTFETFFRKARVNYPAANSGASLNFFFAASSGEFTPRN